MKPLHRTHRTYRKVVFREIRHSLSRFFAIFAIVALGVGFLAGLMATTPDMRLSADAYFDDTNFMDIRVVSTMGLTDDDMHAIREIPGVVGVMPAYQADAQVRTASEDTIVTRFHSLPKQTDTENADYQNQQLVVDGRLPERPGECVVQESLWGDTPVRIGDELRLAPEDGDQSDTFAADRFTVVGIVRSAYYISIERESTDIGSGSIGMMVYLTEDDFAMEVYTNAFVTVDGAKPLTSLTAPYEEQVQPVIDALENLGDVRRMVRLEEVRKTAKEELAEGRQDFEDKRAETEQKLADALAELTDARKKIQDAEAELADGEKKLADGKQELADQKAAFEKEFASQEKKLSEGEQALSDGKAQLSPVKEQLQELKKQLTDGEAARQQLLAAGKIAEAEALAQQLALLQAGYDSGLREYTAQETALLKTESELALARTQLEDGRKQAEDGFAEAEKKLAESRAKLDSGRAELESGRSDLEKGEADYADGRKKADEELGKAQADLDKAAADIDALEPPTWYVFDRMNNAGYASFGDNAQKVEAIATVFPIFFFLVAALVALTTMTRMVEEQRTQIGTMKALGYSKGKIALKYLIYAGTATITGSLFGLLVGFKVFPTVIWGAYDIMYTLPPLLTPFNWKFALISSISAVTCILLVTMFACANSLKECPARLMLPRAPKAGKRVFLERITPLWSRMKFTHKVTARNLIRYKKRFFMTVIGIAGCTGLLLTGFGLRDSIRDIVGKQFGELYTYNTMIAVKDSAALDTNEGLKTILGDSSRIQDFLTLHSETGTLTVDDTEKEAYLYVPKDPQRLSDFIVLRERRSGKPLTLEADTVILTEKLAEMLNAKVGSSISIRNFDGNTASFTVGGIAENYAQGFVYITPQLYEQKFGAAPSYQTVLATATDNSAAARSVLSTQLLAQEDVALVNFNADIQDSFADMIRNIDYVVMVLIVSAGLLAFVVLYNLTNINITERQKELATIKVLGFYDREVSAYIYRETVILTLIGTAVGLVFGIFLHAFVVKTAEVDMVMFGRSIRVMSYVLSAVLTIFFSLLVNLVMYRKMRRIDMVESMKAGE